MAEILGPISFGFGCLSFILSTIPTAAKALNDFSQCVENFRLYEARLVRCKARADKWGVYWRHESDFGEHETIIANMKEDMKFLHKTIEDEINANITDEKESKLWADIRDGLRQGRFRKPKATEKTVSFARSVGFALYQKAVIESWLARFEAAVESIEKLSESAFAHRTADHFTSSPSRKEILEAQELEAFIKGLTSLAQQLHNESAAIATGDEPITYGWALGLRPPGQHVISVEDWKYMAEVRIELFFSVSQAPQANRHFHLDVPFHKDDRRTHLSPEQVRGLMSRLPSPSVVSAHVKCHAQHAQVRRTRPIGDLLMYAPNLLQGEAWQRDRASLIQGISHWALLLWDTSWMEKLCCYGLQIEKGATGPECVAQVLNVGECPKHIACHHGSRLRNLGLTLSQLILGTPIRRDPLGDASTYQQWREDDWKVLFRSDIIAQVFCSTTSTPLCDAISFCLKDQSSLAFEPFQAGFLFECIDHIYKPLSMWYRTETHGLNTHVATDSRIVVQQGNIEWPEHAMYQSLQTPQIQDLQSDHAIPLPTQQRGGNWRNLFWG